MSAGPAPQEGLRAYTVPSTWVYSRIDGFREYQPVTAKQPYDRVVGLITPEGEELWVPPKVHPDTTSAYDRRSVSERTLPFDDVKAERIASYFRGFLSDDETTHEGNSNCHRFAGWVLGQTDRNLTDRHAFADGIVRTGERTEENQAVGQLGVVGYKLGGVVPIAHHSYIGLGKDTDESLQVMWMNGHMGIARYSGLEQFYKKWDGGMLRTLRGKVGLGRYALKNSEPQSANS